MKICKDDGEQIEVPTFGDTGKGVMPMICADCGAQYTVPFDWSTALRGRLYDGEHLDAELRS